MPALLWGVLQAGAPWVLAVGANQPHAAGLAALAFADDDAAAAAELFGGPPERTWLLTTLDAPSQERFSGLRGRARPPTLFQLSLAVAEMARALSHARRQGEAPQVLVWLTGHGAFDERGRFFVALQDGNLTAQALEDLVLNPLDQAHRIHVILDTCHAEAMLKTRASVEPASPTETSHAVFVHNRFSQSQVGFVWAASAQEKTYEWEEIQSGVFSALVRSGLRGAANTNGDDCVSYPELTAYVSAAVQGIALPQARPKVNSFSPRLDQEAPLSCKDWFVDVQPFSAKLGALGPVFVEDGGGAWLAGGNFETTQLTTLWLPQRASPILHARAGEYTWQPGSVLATALTPVTAHSHTQARGAVEHALRTGLFLVPFGSSYFRGFVAAQALEAPPVIPPVAPRWHVLAWLAAVPETAGLVALGTAVISGTVTGFLAYQWWATPWQRQAAEAAQRSLVAGMVTVGVLMLSAALMSSAVALLVVDLLRP